MKTELQTERLLLREFIEEDAKFLFQLNADPLVLKYTGDVPFKDAADSLEFIFQYNQFKQYGTGRYAVIRKKDHAFLGWCGLRYTPHSGEYDIGFRFLRNYWNSGYATEAANKCIHAGFTRLNIPRIIARAHIDNSASVRVLQKCGMILLGKIDFDGEPGVKYFIENPVSRG